MASVVSLDPQLLVFAVLSLTVENVDSMGFVVLMWIQSALSLEIVLAESTRASFPGYTLQVKPGRSSLILFALFKYGGSNELLNLMPEPLLSRTFGNLDLYLSYASLYGSFRQISLSDHR